MKFRWDADFIYLFIIMVIQVDFYFSYSLEYIVDICMFVEHKKKWKKEDVAQNLECWRSNECHLLKRPEQRLWWILSLDCYWASMPGELTFPMCPKREITNRALAFSAFGQRKFSERCLRIVLHSFRARAVCSLVATMDNLPEWGKILVEQTVSMNHSNSKLTSVFSTRFERLNHM